MNNNLILTENVTETFIKGTVEPYWEFGMEGRFEYTFVPNMNPQSVNDGRGYFLKSGDFLRIYKPNGDIAWEGEIRFIVTRISHLFFPDHHHLNSNVWSSQKQKGVRYADWVGWFWSNPRLKAEFWRIE